MAFSKIVFRFSTLTLLASLCNLGCTHDVRRFPLKDPVWVDQDVNNVPERPSSYYSGLMADGADMTFFYPLVEYSYLPIHGDAANVNALDEVPNSSWFTNRIGMFPMTPAEVAKGPCDDIKLDPSQGKFTVVAAKPNGANPGFFIKAANGRRYLLKFDGPLMPPRPTAADVIGSKLYYAAGFFTPCNQVVHFRPDIFEIDPKATSEDKFGNKVPITKDDINKVLGKAFRDKNGMLRASASQFVNGRPIGPFTYQGTRSDDPNDVIPHEDRRELRGARLLAAWLNHFDTREQNSLDVWAKAKGREFLQHYYIDFGDCFGSRWPWDPMARRMGRSYYFDSLHFMTDFITLGAYPRPWNDVSINPEADIFGYFNVEHFVPSEWKGGYRNPSFARMNYRDALWVSRIIQRFSEAHIRAAVSEGKISDERAEEELVRLLMGRRKKILEEYFLAHSPLDHFQVVRRRPGNKTQSLCFEDLAIKENLLDSKKVLYKMRFYGGEDLDEELGWLQFRPDPEHPHRSCVVLPVGVRRPSELAAPRAPDDDPLRYGVLKIFVHQKAEVTPTSSVQLHFYDLGKSRGFRLVGIVRPPEPDIPGTY